VAGFASETAHFDSAAGSSPVADPLASRSLASASIASAAADGSKWSAEVKLSAEGLKGTNTKRVLASAAEPASEITSRRGLTDCPGTKVPAGTCVCR
jgi:hypothetical protein